MLIMDALSFLIVALFNVKVSSTATFLAFNSLRISVEASVLTPVRSCQATERTFSPMVFIPEKRLRTLTGQWDRWRP